MSKKHLTHDNVRTLAQLTSALTDIARELEFHNTNPPAEPPAINRYEEMAHDLRTFLAIKLYGMHRLTRQADGSLNLANRLDGFLSRSASRLGNAAQTALCAEIFFVANDWSDHGTQSLTTRPALFIAEARLEQIGRVIFRSLGRAPTTEDLALMGGELVEEPTLGTGTKYMRFLLPREVIAAVPEIREATAQQVLTS